MPHPNVRTDIRSHAQSHVETQVARVQPASRLGAVGTTNSVNLTHMDFKVTSLSTVPIVVMFVPCFWLINAY